MTGWVLILGACYFYSFERLEYAQAVEACIGLGGKLFEPMDQATNDAVADQAQVNFYWIGINDIAVDDKYI